MFGSNWGISVFQTVSFIPANTVKDIGLPFLRYVCHAVYILYNLSSEFRFSKLVLNDPKLDIPKRKEISQRFSTLVIP